MIRPHRRRHSRLLHAPLVVLLSAVTLVALATPSRALSPVPAWPQERDHEAAPHGHASPYAEQDDSGIAALSGDELRGLEQGAGMGLARAAELNGYPGPKHVLELAEQLELDAEIVDRVATIRGDMEAEARNLGAAIIEAERLLDQRFTHRHVDADTVRETTAEIGRLRGALRAVHLVAHLRTAALLSAAQIERYNGLRGYVEES